MKSSIFGNILMHSSFSLPKLVSIITEPNVLTFNIYYICFIANSYFGFASSSMLILKTFSGACKSITSSSSSFQIFQIIIPNL